jgi:hypothetical protein
MTRTFNDRFSRSVDTLVEGTCSAAGNTDGEYFAAVFMPAKSLAPKATYHARFFPLISFNLINYGAGMTKISWWTFAWTTGIGILPITIIMVIMGDNFNVLPWWTC